MILICYSRALERRCLISPEEVEECEAGEDLVGGEHVLLGVEGHEGAERRQGHDDGNAE